MRWRGTKRVGERSSRQRLPASIRLMAGVWPSSAWPLTKPMGLCKMMVTCLSCCPRASLSTSMRSKGLTGLPSTATSPLTLTQPLAIQSSASRREHRPSSAMRLFSRDVVSLMGCRVYGCARR